MEAIAHLLQHFTLVQVRPQAGAIGLRKAHQGLFNGGGEGLAIARLRRNRCAVERLSEVEPLMVSPHKVPMMIVLELTRPLIATLIDGWMHRQGWSMLPRPTQTPSQPFFNALLKPMSVPNAAPPVKPLTIALVGDIHDQWQEADATALKGLRVDLVLFVGDFGNESVDVVRQVAALDLPKAAVFGNHDAWYTATPWGQRKRPYNPAEEDRFQEQLNLLASVHVGYGRCDFPALNLSVVGSRPFSWGGPEWKTKTFYRDRFKVESFEQSTARIVAAAQASPYSTILMIGHNGPTGLGAQPEDLCGKDWHPVGGDYGDPDFAAGSPSSKPRANTFPWSDLATCTTTCAIARTGSEPLHNFKTRLSILMPLAVLASSSLRDNPCAIFPSLRSWAGRSMRLAWFG